MATLSFRMNSPLIYSLVMHHQIWYRQHLKAQLQQSSHNKTTLTWLPSRNLLLKKMVGVSYPTEYTNNYKILIPTTYLLSRTWWNSLSKILAERQYNIIICPATIRICFRMAPSLCNWLHKEMTITIKRRDLIHSNWSIRSRQIQCQYLATRPMLTVTRAIDNKEMRTCLSAWMWICHTIWTRMRTKTSEIRTIPKQTCTSKIQRDLSWIVILRAYYLCNSQQRTHPGR